MATYWKSQPRKFCDVCKCWLSDNKASIEFHERGKSHKEKKEKQITQLRKKSQREYKNQQKAGKYLQQMEEAAAKKYKEDLQAQGIELRDSNEEETQTKSKRNNYSWVNSYPNRPSMPKIPKSPWTEQKSPDGSTYYWNTETGKSQWEKPDAFVHNVQPKLPDSEFSSNVKNPPKSPWIEKLSPDDTTYYWNTETGKSQWEKPEGYIPQPKPITSDLKDTKKSPWTEQKSPDGHTYYWNTETGKSNWEKPEGFIPLESPKPPEDSKIEASASTKHSLDSEDDPEEIKPGLKRTRLGGGAYGGWTVVKQPKPAKKIDLQLPAKMTNPAKEGLIDRTALEKERTVQPVTKFREKTVVSLGGDSGAVSFRKKGTGKQRSIRKRIEE